MGDNTGARTDLRDSLVDDLVDEAMTAMVGDIAMMGPVRVPWPKRYKRALDLLLPRMRRMGRSCRNEMEE